MEIPNALSDKATKKQLFKFSALRNIDSTMANIFIHGYSAGHTLSDRELIRRSIPPEIHGQLNITAFWPSSHITRVNRGSKGLVALAARIHVAAGVAIAAADRAAHFAQIRARADEMGDVLLQQLQAYLLRHHPMVERVNLIGHSLGGRVAVKALTTSRWDQANDQVEIGHVLLMAAATAVSHHEVLSIIYKIDGLLINAYSTEDKILLLNVDENSVGLKGLPSLRNLPRVVVDPSEHKVRKARNVRMKGFSHTDYWPKLRSVMQRSKFPVWSDRTDLALRPEKDFAKRDVHLYEVLSKADTALLSAAIEHLESSPWTTIEHEAADRALTCTREFQGVAGNCLANLVRGRGLSYAKTLEMLTEHYGLTRELHECATVVEYEKKLLSCVLRHMFPEGHPLGHASTKQISEMPQSVYLEAIGELAKRLTLASYLRLGNRRSSQSEPLNTTAKAGDEAAPHSFFRGARGFLAGMETEVVRVLTNMKIAVQPGFSALIPTVAIVYYARLQVGEDDLM